MGDYLVVVVVGLCFVLFSSPLGLLYGTFVFY